MKDLKIVSDSTISYDEFEAVRLFLSYYKNQKFIIADKFRQDFNTLPIMDQKFAFISNEESWKSVNFSKNIKYKGKNYLIQLSLWRVEHNELSPTCLSINEFTITSNGVRHFINLNLRDVYLSQILFYILSIFEESKIISPEQAYAKEIYVDYTLQKFIENHDWDSILKGISDMPSLNNALFVVNESTKKYDYEGYFATILYQLINYKLNDGNKTLNGNDLEKLNKLIEMLKKERLLKVRLIDSLTVQECFPTSSVLLRSYKNAGHMHISEQFTVSNNGLTNEKNALNVRRLIK